MKKIREFLPSRISSKPAVFLLGNFDGIHLGHTSIFQKAIQLAKEHNLQAVILTFQNHPAEVLRPNQVPLKLISAEKKTQMIEEFSFDVLIDLVFDEKLANMSADEFFSKIVTMLPLSYFVAGSDVAFGKDRKGNKDFLAAKALEMGFEAVFVDKLSVDGVTVSSSIIRKLIQDGLFEMANSLLGRPYEASCKVVKEAPKLIVDADHFALPKAGKYRGFVRQGETGELYAAEIVVSESGLLEIVVGKITTGCKSIEVQFERLYTEP